MMKRLFLSTLLCLASVATLLADNVQIKFTGQCSDCSGQAVAVLTVKDFTPDSVFTLNLDDVSFSYTGTNLVDPFVIDAGNVRSVSGTLGPSFPAPYDVSLVADDLRPGFEGEPLLFSSKSDGSWEVSVASQPRDDVGTSSAYSIISPSAVPEPPFPALTGFLVLCLCLLQAHRKRTAEQR